MEAASSVDALGDDEALPVALTVDRRRPVADQLYEALREAIISVRLPPNTAISENRICRHFGVSRTPVRAALIRLVEDELIEVFPQQGSFVAPIKLSTIRDSHFVRKSLELAVLREVARVWTPQRSAAARALIATQRTAVEAGDDDAFHAADHAFHRSFAMAAGLAGVWTTIQGAKGRIDRLHRLAAVEGRLPVVVIEHLAVIDALDAGDVEAAVERLDYHLDRILDLLGLLRERHAAYFVA